MSTAPLMAFWSVSKDSSSGEIVEIVLDGPSAMPCRPKKTGVVSHELAAADRGAAVAGGSVAARVEMTSAVRATPRAADLRLNIIIDGPPCSRSRCYGLRIYRPSLTCIE